MTYDVLADEYYDRSLHPTSHAFREASLALLLPQLANLRKGLFLEVGSGRSIFEDLPPVQRPDLIVVTDRYERMLRYSVLALDGEAQLALADAATLPIAHSTIDTVISSLGDPYNTPTFWSEARRVLRPGGRVLFTTPSFDWSHQFRSSLGNDQLLAEFPTRDGGHLSVCSLVFDTPVQCEMIEKAALHVVEVSSLSRDSIPAAEHAPKLQVTDGPLVTLYIAEKIR
jgi:SAM-dependent methyltransferase